MHWNDCWAPFDFSTNNFTGRMKSLGCSGRFCSRKLIGLNDKGAALAAGYSLSVAENTKQKIWAKPGVQEQFERLKEKVRSVFSPEDTL
jgi:hypothetical protein